MSARRRWVRWLGRGLLLVAAVPVVIALALLFGLATASGRAWALGVLLTQVNGRIPGRLEVGVLERLGPDGIVLRDVRLHDPAGSVVLELGSLAAELEPFELATSRIVLSRLALGPGRVDLRGIDAPGSGLLAALVDPAAPPAPPQPGPPPYVRVDHIAVDGLELDLPDLAPPWRALRVRGLTARAWFELDGQPEVRLTSLSCELERDARLLARLEHADGQLGRPGATSQLSLRVAFGAAARASLRAQGVLPPAPEHALSPLAAELELAGLTAHDLGELLRDPALGESFAGPLGLRSSASGTLEQLLLSGTVDTAAGAIDVRGALRERRFVEVALATRGLVLSRIRADLPSMPLTLERLAASTDLRDPARLPVDLRATPGRLGAFALPALEARGTWNGRSLRGLSLALEQGQSRLSVRGSADIAGSFDVHVGAAFALPELQALATAAGLMPPPQAALNADLHVKRAPNGTLSVQGNAGANGIRLTELALDSARVEIALEGPPLALEGQAHVRVRGLARGATRVPRADFRVLARGGAYRLRGSADVDRSHLELDVRARPEPDHWSLEGNASGRWEQLPFALRLRRTTVSPAGWVETRGIVLDAGEQQVHVTGGVGRARSELRISAPALSLAPLGRIAGLGDDWSGTATLDVRLRGRVEAPSLELTIAARDVARGAAAALKVRLDARLDAEAGRASLDAAIASSSRPTWVDASVALGSEFQGGPGWERALDAARQSVRVELRQLDLGALGGWLGGPLPVSARIGLSASLEGTLREPRVRAQLRAADVSSPGWAALTIEHRFAYAAGELSAALDVDDAAGRWLRLGADMALAPADARDLPALLARARAIGDTARWSLRLDAARRRLGALWTDAPAAAAGLELDAQIQLDHEPGAEPAGRARVRVGEARLPTSPPGCSSAGVELAFDAKLAERNLEAGLAATRGRTRLLTSTTTATLELGPALRGGTASLGSLASELSSRGLDLQTLPFLCGRVRGRVDAQVALADPLGASPTLDAKIDATGLSLGAEPNLGLELAVRADGAAVEARSRVTGPRGASHFSAQLPIRWSSGRLAVAPDAPLRARARLAALPIAPLLDPAGAVSYATGWLSGSIDVAGTIAEPEPSGTLELAGAELTATALAQPLHGVRGRVAFDRRALSIEHFEARDRDGELKLSGRVDRGEGQAFDVTLDVKAEQFPLRQRGQVVATTSGQAKIQASSAPGRTTVAVKLIDADTWLERAQARTGIDLAAHPDVVLAEPASAAPRRRDAKGDAPEVTHIRLDASDRFWIKRDDFAIQLSTRLDARIVGDQAKVTGKVDISRGYLDLMGRVFEVARGSRLEFIGSSKPDPVVDIGASYDHRGSGKTVRVQISGRGSKPVLTFFVDDSEVSAGEVLELLLGGRGSGGETSAKNEATSFVSALTAGLLATSARRELGAAAPIIMIEPGDQTGDGRIRAGFELDALVPRALRQLITGVYVEGIVEREGSGNSRGQTQEASTQAGVLLELYFPHQLFSTGQWGPGTTWSIDWGWQL